MRKKHSTVCPHGSRMGVPVTRRDGSLEERSARHTVRAKQTWVYSADLDFFFCGGLPETRSYSGFLHPFRHICSQEEE
jgi:hypothetical protein